jgi:beta-fructofuranosidase
MTSTEPAALHPTTRHRPRVHFTAADGWVNDPYGVTWDGSQYHLFYQALPGRVTWAPNAHWGHAVSPDLVHWRELPLALSPARYETGCWSGSYLNAGANGMPTILYTRIAGDNWNMGQVAIARGTADSLDWTTGVDDIVIAGAPAELKVKALRDPYVWKANDGWKLILGAALPDDTAAALQYHSADLQHWSYDGILCSRSGAETEETWTGTLWECPQLFALGDDWVLLVSVWHDDNLNYVAAAIGDYDGARFRPRRWQQLTYGSSAYAMSTFVDANGQRCVLSWLREEPRNNAELRGFAGAHSVAATITVTEGHLVLSPHPSVAAAVQSISIGPGERFHLASPNALMIALKDNARRLDISDDEGERCRITITDRAMTIHRAGRADELLSAAVTDIRLLLDEDILEIFTASHYGAYRLRPSLGDNVISG